MEYEAVYLYNSNNEFIGVTIKKTHADLLHSVNIWHQTDEEIEDFKRTLSGLNDEHALRQFWPGAHDAEVAELVENPEWEPLKLYETEVPDWDNSTLVFEREPVSGWEYDSEEDRLVPKANALTGEVEWVDTDDIDRSKSTIVMTKAMVPDATDAQNRYFKAQETVARRRLDASR